MRKKGNANLIFRRVILLSQLGLISVIFLESCLYIEGQKHFLLKNADAVLYIVTGVILSASALLLLFQRVDRVKEKNRKKAILLLWSMTIIIQTVICCFLIKDGFKGITDTSRVINEAIAMVESQDGLIDNTQVYFARYGNNYPFTILVYYICKIVHFFGLRCYTAVLMVLNVILIDLSAVFSLKLVKMVKGPVAGIKFMILFFLSPTTYLWIVFTYTNTFSMPFVMGLLYYGIKAMRRAGHRLQNTAAAAVIGAVGYQIRATTIIPVIAVLIGILLAKRIRSAKEKISMFLLSVGIFIAVMLISSFICRAHLVNRDQDRTFPFTHWVMMGVNESKSGFVNTKDVKYSMSMETKREKMEGNFKKIGERLSKMGLTGYIVLLMKKLEYVWGIGSDGYPGFYVNGEAVSGIYQYILGDKGGGFAIYCQIFRCMTLFFVLCSLVFQWKKRGVEEFFVIPLTVLGAILFFLLWETNRKYNICFMNLFYILMGDGISRIVAFAWEKESAHGYLQKKCCIRATIAVFVLIPVLITIRMIMVRPYYVQKKSDYHRAAVMDLCYQEEYIVLKKKGDIAEQTFETDRQFNEICLKIKYHRKVGKDDYLFQLLDENGKIVVSRKLPGKNTDEHWNVFPVGSIPAVADARKYTIQILCMREQEKGISLAVTLLDAYDQYEGGEMKINGSLSKRDMVFCADHRKKESLIRPMAYILSGILVWGFAGTLGFLILKKGKRLLWEKCRKRD